MGIDFPASPVPGQQYPSPPVGVQPVYMWDGEKWTTTGGNIVSAVPGTALPLMDATPAVVGSTTKFAREDHIHPTDTSRVAKAGDTMTGHLVLPTSPAAANAVRKDYVDAAVPAAAIAAEYISNSALDQHAHTGRGVERGSTRCSC